jgi:hypothetical protein
MIVVVIKLDLRLMVYTSLFPYPVAELAKPLTENVLIAHILTSAW